MEQLYHEYNQWNKIGNYDGNSNNRPPAPPPWLSLVKDILFDQRSSSMSSSSEQCLRKNMILLLSHVIQLPTTLRAISLLGYDLYIDVTDLESWGAYYSFDDVMLSKNNNKCKMKVIVTTSNKISKRLGQGLILVVPDVTINETHSAMIEQIITNFDYTGGTQSLLSKQIIDQEVGYRKRNFCVIHSSIKVLKQCKPFLGEDA
jgi:hypothetical protein